MGPRAEEIFKSFDLPRPAGLDAGRPWPTYESVKGKFDNYFNKKTNLIYERSRFNLRIQKEGEAVDEFITNLHYLANRCNYGDLKEELIRDRIVVGIRDKKLQQKLQLNKDLTLEKATTAVRASEQNKKENEDLKRTEQSNFPHAQSSSSSNIHATADIDQVSGNPRYSNLKDNIPREVIVFQTGKIIVVTCVFVVEINHIIRIFAQLLNLCVIDAGQKVIGPNFVELTCLQHHEELVLE